MSDYLTAHAARMVRNHNEMLALAKELIKRGYKVYAPKDKLISFIKVLSDTHNATLGFGEVPYHWYIDISWKPVQGSGMGSGRGVHKSYGGENLCLTLTADDVISHMAENTPGWKPNVSYLRCLNDGTTTYRIYQDKKLKQEFTGCSTDFVPFGWLLRNQSQSVNWALKHGGWAVEEINEQTGESRFWDPYDNQNLHHERAK